jgi:hypothetical protein
MANAAMRPDFLLLQIASRDLDVAIVSQLPAASLPLGDEFEPSSVKVVRFKASFRRRSIGEQDLEDAPGNPHHALIFADTDPELDGVSVRIPSGVGRKAEEHELHPLEVT